MAVKTIFSKVDFGKILTEYDLGEFVSAMPFTAGTVQTNYRLQTTKGEFAFRYYEKRAKKAILFEIDLIRHLRANKYPCPALYINKRGKYVGTYKRKPYVIFEYVLGEHLEQLDEQQNSELVQKVAELHIITNNYQPVNTNQRWNYSSKLCRELAATAAKRINSKNAREKLCWFNKELQSIKLPKSLPKGVCHGDFHFTNVLFNNGRFRALLDFDDANYTCLIYDLAALINPFVKAFEWNSWTQFTRFDNVFDFREARLTVAEYMQTRTLSKKEKRHMFDIFKLSIMLDCIWRFERGAADDFFEKRKIEHLNALGRKSFRQQLFGY